MRKNTIDFTLQRSGWPILLRNKPTLDTSVRLASVAEITSKKAPNNRNHHTELLPFHTSTACKSCILYLKQLLQGTELNANCICCQAKGI